MDQINNRQVVDLDIDQIQPNPLQPRGIITHESISDLIDSIKEHGVLEPLVVAHTPAGYQIIVGERRWRAAKIANLSKVPCLVKETSPQGMLELAIVENVQREDLNPIDRAKAFERLVEEFGLSKSEIAKRISKSAPYISNTLKLLELPDAIKDGLLSGLVTEGHARALQGIHDMRLMVEAYKLVLKESASVRRAEEIARRMKIAAGQTTPLPNTAQSEQHKFIIDEKVDQFEDEMKDILGKKVRVRLRRSLKQTKLFITLLGTPEDTEEKLVQIHQAILGIKPATAGGQ
jgi:ParB family chromosome partitioning protein